MTPRQIIHVDMDAFYASVEQRDDPALRGKPVIVGGDSRRGVVAAASYEVREFGVRSAMSMVEAKRRCPHAIVVPPQMNRYSEVSADVFAIFRRFTPEVEGLSVDEAFLDVTHSRRLHGDAVAIAKKIKRAIHDELNLTASAGVASSKFVAKIASDLDKPDGLVIVAAESTREFLAPLPLERMWGVGKKAAARLHDAGFQTIGDLAEERSARALETLLGSWGASVHRLAQGIDDREVVPHRDAKSIGAEHTFERDLRSLDDLMPKLLAQCVRVADRLTRKELYGTVLTVKVKYADHRQQTRQLRLPQPSRDADSLYEGARRLIVRFDGIARGVRLTGISVSGLVAEVAPTLFPDEEQAKRERLAHLTVALKDRFGGAGLTRARLLDAPSNDSNEDGPNNKD